jgi:1,4-dihydroxy-6-naphthoate synthase
MKIRLGHSPDSDDAFMFWGLASGEVKTEYEFEHILRDIQTLNDWALEGKLESSAVSVHAFAYVADKYALLRHGGSFGDSYGPMIVARRPLSLDELRDTVIAVPGTLTSAFLQLNLYFDAKFRPAVEAPLPVGVGAEEGDVPATHPPVQQGEPVKPRYEVVPFDEIIPAILSGKYEAGLIIHEGQLTYERDSSLTRGKGWF